MTRNKNFLTSGKSKGILFEIGLNVSQVKLNTKQGWSAVSSVAVMRCDEGTRLGVAWSYSMAVEVRSVSCVFWPFVCVWQLEEKLGKIEII